MDYSSTLKQECNPDADDVEQQKQINKQGDDDDQQVKQMPITAIMVVNKGKRTKRQRLHSSDSSPIRSSSMNDHQQKGDAVVDDDDNDEQLDMAKCLMLLAQGQSRPLSSYSPPPASILGDQSGQLSGSKRRRSYSSSSLSLGLAAGVYACHTCNRTFPSFQALGGHRAGHKRLKITATSTSATSFHDYFNNPLSLQLGNINYSRVEAPPNPILIPTTAAVVNAQITNINGNKKSINKIHECTICGAEFSSGQALGGHMRRHRGPVVPLNSSTTATSTIAANTTLSLSTTATVAGKVVDRINNKNDSFLSLDLNMPASPSPESNTKFSLHPKQQSAALVFSTAASLVDCSH